MQQVNCIENQVEYVERRSQKGFSLIELTISLTLFLIVTGAVYSSMQLAQNSRHVVNRQVETERSARFALQLLGRDTYNAGYGYPLRSAGIVLLPDNRISTLLGVPNDFDATRDTVPPIIAGNNITTNTYTELPNVKTDQITFLFKDTTFNTDPALNVSQPLNINAATTSGSGSSGIDEIVPISGSNAACRINDIYLVTGGTGSTLGVATALSGSNKVQFANNDVLKFNQTGTSGPLRSITTPASMQRVLMVTYMVTPDGTLIRRDYANRGAATPAVGYTDEPLAYGVEDFQITYVMDDGSISDNPSAGVDGIAGNTDDAVALLAAVRQVRYTIRIRSTTADNNGEFMRVSMTSTFGTRNLGYEAN